LEEAIKLGRSNETRERGFNKFALVRPLSREHTIFLKNELVDVLDLDDSIGDAFRNCKFSQ